MKYIYKHGNQFWYQRAVPENLVCFFEKKTFKVSLKTNKLEIAVKRANEQAKQHSLIFRELKKKKIIFPILKKKINAEKFNCEFFCDFDPSINLNEQFEIAKSFNIIHKNKLSKQNILSPKISEVLRLNNKFNFTVDQKKSIKLLIKIIGDKVINEYNKNDVKYFKADFFDKQCVGEGKIHQINLAKCFDYFCKEFSFCNFNIFKKIKWVYPSPTPLNYSQLLSVKNECFRTKNQISYAIAIMLNTGCSINEILGLEYDDIFLSEYKNYVVIRSNQYRQIKNNYNKRTVPLVGLSIWGARSLKRLGKKNCLLFESFFFPKKKFHQFLISINKQLKKTINKTSYSLCNTVVERLKNINCPDFVILDVIGRKKEHILYNNECSFEMKNSWLKQIEI